MYSIDAFVNGNARNIELEHKVELDDVQSDFEQHIEFDACDDAAFPVLVYTKSQQPIAWVDLECACGYIVR